MAALWLLASSQAVLAQSAAGGVSRQTVGGSLSYASLWDDETHLGRGLAAAAEVAAPVGDHLRVAMEAGWFGHHRNAGYLAADGAVLSLTARAFVMLGPRAWRARPLVGAGAGVARSTGILTFGAFGPSSVGSLGPESESRKPWTNRGFAWELHAGARVRVSGRLAVRPEVRVGVVAGPRRDRRALEPPLLRLQGGMAFEWAVR